jgi:hypothetical protein
LTVTLLHSGGSEETADSSTLVAESDGSATHSFDFSTASPITEYEIKIVATRATAEVAPFVVVERLDIAV